MIGETVAVEGIGEVEDVLVAPGRGTEPASSYAPPGVPVIYELHFPKSFSGRLAGRKVTVRGEPLDVVGDPRPYQPENTPTRWWMPAEVGDFGMTEPIELVRMETAADDLGDVSSSPEHVCGALARVVGGGAGMGWDAQAASVERSVSFWCRWSEALGKAARGDVRPLRVEWGGREFRVSDIDDKNGAHLMVEIKAVVKDG